MSKIFSYLLFFLINFALLTFIIFFFSFISLINQKTYDWFWINSIQKKLYFDYGLRKIWQVTNNCTIFDEQLLFIPKDGKCIFSNAEYNIEMNYKDGIRYNGNDFFKIDSNNSILVVGDSIAAGWGVNDNETYSSKLEILLNKKINNLSVPGYGTIREIKKINNFKYLDKVDTIIIHYGYDDIFENKNSNINKIYTKKNFDDMFNVYQSKEPEFYTLLRYYKKSFRILYHDIYKMFNKDKYLLKVDLQEHFEIVEKLIDNYLKVKNKKIILLFIQNPEMKITKLPKEKSNNIEYLILNSNKADFYTVDDHLTANGHSVIAKKLFDFIKNN